MVAILQNNPSAQERRLRYLRRKSYVSSLLSGLVLFFYFAPKDRVSGLGDLPIDGVVVALASFLVCWLLCFSEIRDLAHRPGTAITRDPIARAAVPFFFWLGSIFTLLLTLALFLT